MGSGSRQQISRQLALDQGNRSLDSMEGSGSTTVSDTFGDKKGRALNRSVQRTEASVAQWLDKRQPPIHQGVLSCVYLISQCTQILLLVQWIVLWLGATNTPWPEHSCGLEFREAESLCFTHIQVL